MPTESEHQLSFVDRVEDRIAISFYRTLFEAPATLLAVKHSFYFNETYGETPSDRAIVARIKDPFLRGEVVRHLDDEVRHAALWRNYLEPRGELPTDDALAFGDFVGMLRAARWFPNDARVAEDRPLDDDELMAFFAVIHVVETQAVRQMIAFRRVLEERDDRALVDVITTILRDEGRHMAYSKRALHRIGERGGAEGVARAHALEQLAFRAFLRLRAGDMRKVFQYVFAHDAASLSFTSRLKLRTLATIIRTFPTRVPDPHGTLTIDASKPLEGARTAALPSVERERTLAAAE